MPSIMLPEITSQNYITTAANHVKNILAQAIKYDKNHSALIVYDSQSPLALILAQAYRIALPQAELIDFDNTDSQTVLNTLAKLQANDLVVLIQSTSFRLQDFRIRVNLFERAIKVIEHPHLARMQDAQIQYYIDSLAYDTDYYHGIGHALKNRLDKTEVVRIKSGEDELIFQNGLEPAKLNIGDYRGMKNVGGQFPIGEVFTEARELENVNGRVQIFAFADCDFKLNIPIQPITLVIEQGKVINAINTTDAFEAVLHKIRLDEQVVWLRELGFGMNKAFSKDRFVPDIGTYERMCGVHLSLGAKHTVYKKPHLRTRDTRHHVDVFVLTEQVYLDDVSIYLNDGWQI